MMQDRTTFIIQLCVLTFIGVLAMIGLTVWIIRILYSRKGMADNSEVLEAIEGGRQQQSAEHSAMQGTQQAHGSALRQLLDRFGFLKRIK